MNVKVCATFLMLLAAAGTALAQGFAGLAADESGFALPAPGYAFHFPEDHGPHPDYRLEWWYVTLNLEGPDGTTYGAQWTLFRSALAPPGPDEWEAAQIWMGHAALTSPDRHFAEERFARGGIGQAGVTAQPFAAWIDAWEFAGPTPNSARLTARGADFAYDLTLEADRPFVAQGDGGYSVKTPDGHASYYYSQPFYEVSGTLSLGESVIPVTGTGWLDREWFSRALSGAESGWDWVGLSFADGARLMAARIRGPSGPLFSAATWIAPDGTPTPYPNGALVMTPLATAQVAGRSIPTRWRVALPDRGLDVTAEAINPGAWMDLTVSYWEGPVRVTGSHTGTGYLEMTGYE